MSELYNSQIVFSTKELSPKEKVSIKKGTNALKFDEVVTDEGYELDLDYAAALAIHNEKNEKGEKDYNTYILVDKDGTRYTTSSTSFWESFMEIYEELKDETDWKLLVCKKPSKNYSGKFFLTCDVI